MTRFYTLFSNGGNFNAMHPLELVKGGQPQGLVAGNAHVEWDPDVVVFMCPQQPVHQPRPHGACATIGDNAYVIGFAGEDAPQLSFNSGTVSSVTFGFFTIDTYAEPGYSGSPSINIDGFLIGMVNGGHDPNGSKQVTAVPAQYIKWFLQQGAPKLSGIPE